MKTIEQGKKENTILMEKVINLENILRFKVMGKPFSESLIIDAMREACELTIQLCKENIIKSTIESENPDCCINTEQLASIEKTKNQIK